MNKKEILEFYNNEYWKKYKKFSSLYSLDFVFSVNVFEKCLFIFTEIGLNNFNDFDNNFFEYNEFWLRKLSKQLNLEYNHKILKELYVLYKYNLILFNSISKYCNLKIMCIGGKPEKIEDHELRSLKRSKYKTEDGKKKYFYEFECLAFDCINFLQILDSIRKKLIENGDTIELINQRDFTISLHKYYNYLSECTNFNDK